MHRSYIASTQESEESSRYHHSNEHKLCGRKMWAQETHSAQVPINQTRHNIYLLF